MKTIKTPGRIVLYTRPICGWCQDAKSWLDERGWIYEGVDVGKDVAARSRAIEISGQPLVPVIEVDGFVLGDFDTGQLELFLQKHGYLA